LACALGLTLNDPVFHLDHTNWKRRDHNAFISDHDDFIKKDQWIVDGNYSACMPNRLNRVTSVIFLDFEVFEYLGRYVYLRYPHNSIKYNKLLKEYMQDKPVIILKNFSELDDLYSALSAER